MHGACLKKYSKLLISNPIYSLFVCMYLVKRRDGSAPLNNKDADQPCPSPLCHPLHKPKIAYVYSSK